MERALAEQLKSSKFSKSMDNPKRRGCYYTPIPRFIKHKEIRGQELTSLNLDKTELLESVLTRDYEGAEDLLLAELQFAFITFLMGQSLEGFLQWKNLVSLLLGCSKAPFRTRSQLFTKFLSVIYYQLKYGLQKEHRDTSAAKDVASTLLDESWLSADSFLYCLCKAHSIMSSAGNSQQPSRSSAPPPSSQSSGTAKEKAKLPIIIGPTGIMVGANSRKWSNRFGDYVRSCIPDYQ